MMDNQSFTGTCPTCGQQYLGAEVERLTGWRAKWMETAKALEAENERLRSALRLIAMPGDKATVADLRDMAVEAFLADQGKG